MTLVEIIEALEKATGPSREADAAICEAVGAVNERHCRERCSQNGRTDLTREIYVAAWAADYTSKIDHALTLVPHKHDNWSIRTEPAGYHAQVWCMRPRALEEMTPDDSREWKLIEGYGHAPTPALALAIAALRARLQHGGAA